MSSSSAGTNSLHSPTVLGAVSFLNAKPLVAGLRDVPGIRLEYAVPSALSKLLATGRADAALLPVVDLETIAGLRSISDACIASDGETLTVRVFSRVPPNRVRRLQVDGDSHTSIVLAKVVWSELFGAVPEVGPLGPRGKPHREDGMLLIGDKVVALRPRGFAFEVDLGAAWRELTDLPFVYAVWAMPADREPGELAEVLSRSRDLGERMAGEIAETEGPIAGWPVEIARRYLTEHMDYRLTDRHRQGMALFLGKARELNLLSERQEGAA
ncbi:MAG: menaquinone biosynthesis protein [Phycisphaerae bacterium]|nr:menaquinone biosynthesis protein [Phycisphaerae bacterium]